MKSKFEIFLDTDIFTQHLSRRNFTDSSLLQKCKVLFDRCYTSVINASEIFSACNDNKAVENAKVCFDDIGILGIPFRYSVKIGEVMKIIKKKDQETLIGML